MRRAILVGASDGIGLAVARKLLQADWEVLSIARRASPVEHDHHRTAVLDVRDPGYRRRLTALVDAHGPFDVCVYCAGIGDMLDPATMQPEHDVFAVNLLGAAATGEVEAVHDLCRPRRRPCSARHRDAPAPPVPPTVDGAGRRPPGPTESNSPAFRGPCRVTTPRVDCCRREL